MQVHTVLRGAATMLSSEAEVPPSVLLQPLSLLAEDSISHGKGKAPLR